MQLAFAFDLARCSGCMACVVACLDEKDLPDAAHAFRHVIGFENPGTAPPTLSFFSLSCLHCADAPCVTVCPAGSLQKRDLDGIVTFNRDLCMGCRSCESACPFGAPRFPEKDTMAKCDFCLERIEARQQPACVRVCPTRALRFGPVDELTEETARKASLNILEVFG
ncbi:MAG: 4Fe-4S dicluster domain-containing protein [Deltaproteobacteria bacterium]|nr:4Fe-4S dicluster domain-containing protein [Deltaproteobacteria bacterium]